ncbi:hypothetical protein V5O48_002044 [Marasmius crinis-equi]|uniref:RING-type domain-containing protein n=1 Tax=Marasmius crinis-equi TaxID=585013 RepID=A0ABR3FWT9_9AGAR
MSSPKPTRARSRSNTRSKAIATPKLKQKKMFPVIEISDSESDGEVEEGRNGTAAAAMPAAGPSKTPGFAQERPRASPFQQRTFPDENAALPKAGKAEPFNPIQELFLPSDEENEPPRRKSRPAVVDVDADFEEIVDRNNKEVINIDRLDSPPPSATPEEQASVYLVQVLEIVPNVQPDHATALILEHLPKLGANVVEFVLHSLFENPDYPKVDHKGKRKALTELASSEEVKKARNDTIDYGSVERDFKGGVHYVNMAIDQLMLDFPAIPKPHVRRTLLSKKSLYAPTYFYLEEEKKSGRPLPYTPKKTVARRPAKGKGPALEDTEFEIEREWLVQKLTSVEARNDAKLAEQLNEQEYEDNGDGIECGCCFTTYAFDKMVQCEDGHLFCTECMVSYAENLLGSHNVSIVCMDQSGCKLPFPVSELRRFLPDKLMELYERVKQRKEIELAGLEGLEECPHCEYKCVIENPDEKLFRCGNFDSCGAITCRQCKKPDHLPKSCREVEDDRRLDGRHAIEEAMTAALMRNCPKCNKGFVKDDGCNKMTCPNCHSLSCYVCRKLIPEGYAHFNQAPHGTATTSKQSKKCPLYDGPVEARHAREVQEAAAKAKEAYLADNPDIEDKEIHVDVPKAPPAAQMPRLAMPNLPQVVQYPLNLAGHHLGIAGFPFGYRIPAPPPHVPHAPDPLPVPQLQPHPHPHVHRRQVQPNVGNLVHNPPNPAVLDARLRQLAVRRARRR